MSVEYFDNEKYSNKNPLLQFALRRFVDVLVEFIVLTGAKDILDAGCGEGFLLERILKRLPNHMKNVCITAFDSDRQLLMSARQRLSGVFFEEKGINNIDYEPERFDLILCTQTLEYLRDPLNALKSFKKVGKKWFIFSVPNEPYFRICNFIRGRYLKRLGNKPSHLHTWTKRQFLNMVKNEFRIEKISTLFPYIIVLCSK